MQMHNLEKSKSQPQTFDPEELMLSATWRHASEEAVRAGQRLIRYRRKRAAKALSKKEAANDQA
jgi:hypothetical protein